MSKPNPKSIYHDLKRSLAVSVSINFILLFLVALLILKADKPPLVFRYLPTGELDVYSSLESSEELRGIDTKVFLELFVNQWNLDDSFAIQQNLPKALRLMNESLQSDYLDKLNKDTIQTISQKNIKTLTDIHKIDVTPYSDSITATVHFTRVLISMDNTTLEKKKQVMELVLDRLPQRTKVYPHGLAIRHFKVLDIKP